MNDSIKQLARHPFASFCEEVMETTVVCQALHRLNASGGFNANLVLFAFWYAKRQHGRLRKRDFTVLQATICTWHERITRELRQLSDSIEQIGSQKARQLQIWIRNENEMANQIEQRLLVEGIFSISRQARNASQQLGDACYNFITYCKLKKIYLNEEDQQALLILLRAVFPDFALAEIEEKMHYVLGHHNLTVSHYSQLALESPL